MNIYDIYKQVEGGAKFTINLEKRTLRLNGKLVEIDDAETFCSGLVKDQRCFFGSLRQLYLHYKYSVPSERSLSRRHNYFRALPEKNLRDIDMMFGLPREQARFNIEMFVLCALLCGLTWHESWGTWFWQDPDDKDLVLLREWIEPKND